jgi:hypothetical protein
VVLVVITTSAKVERWARRPIRMGEGSVIVPRVVGPSSIPMMDALEIARAPGVAMLSTLAHQEDPGAAQQALWTLEALATGGHDAEGRLADILQAALTAAVREEMERLMRSGKYEYQSEFAKTYFTRGRVEGRTQTLLEVLRSRGWSLTDEVVQRIESERDEDRLQAWTRRAVTCAHVDDVFADG